MSETESMRLPSKNFPTSNPSGIRANWNLPSHYRLKDVRCEYGSMALPGVPDDFQIVIEYESLPEEPEPGRREVESYQAWAEPLVAMIREEWPA